MRHGKRRLSLSIYRGTCARCRNRALIAALIQMHLGVVRGRDVQHKVFRVERMFGGRAAARSAGAAAQNKAADPKPEKAGVASPEANHGTVQSLKRELAMLHDAVAHNIRELAALIGDSQERHMAHAAGKLGAAIEGMEKATEKILKSAELIDDSAKALAAAMKTDYERGLAQEIQDHVVKIYEACNFQDLSGQRIGHVIETLNSIEDQVEGMLERHNGRPADAPAGKPFARPALLNGPRLDGDSGDTSQSDIDALFG
jgi:chemotaxis protein CheZ